MTNYDTFSHLLKKTMAYRHVEGVVGVIVSGEDFLSPRCAEVAKRLWNGALVGASFYATYRLMNRLRKCVHEALYLAPKGHQVFRCGSVVVSVGSTYYLFGKLSL